MYARASSKGQDLGRASDYPRPRLPSTFKPVRFRLAANAAVTQLGECKTEDLEVAGSSPARGIRQLALIGKELD